MADFLSAAAEAAPAFGMQDAEIEVLAQSENTVCKLTIDDERFVMRLHRPGYNTRAELDSEVGWVQALATAGIPVPTATPTIDGGYYTSVEIDGASVEVGVVEWVEGQPLAQLYGQQNSKRSITEDYRRIGTISAQIRRHGEGWNPPEGFVRRRWDTDAFLGETPAWGRFWEATSLSAAQKNLFVQARALLTTELSSMNSTPSHFGLIHADLHLGNVMANGDALTIIDFDDAGYSWFAYDLAVALHPLLKDDAYEPARAAMIDGYRSIYPLSKDEEASIDTFLTLRSLIDVGWLAARPELQQRVSMSSYIALAEERAAQYVEAAG